MTRKQLHSGLLLTIKAVLIIILCAAAETQYPPAGSESNPRKLPEDNEDFMSGELQQLIFSLVEDILETQESAMDPGSIIATLESLATRPLNLNQASASQLRQLFMLSDRQIHQLLQHIAQHGPLLSLYELQTIEGFSASDIRMIRPFVTVGEMLPRRHLSRASLVNDGENVLFLRVQRLLEQQKGFSDISQEAHEADPNARYLGSPYRLYARYRYTWYQNISVGVTAEKDPGEEFFRGSQPQGFDFYSGHFFLRDMGRVKALAVGDFQAQFGQGLIFWSGMGFGKSSEGIGIKKNGRGLLPYTSVDENNFLRGTGVTIQAGPFEITAFHSSKHRDASVSQSDSLTGAPLAITSLQQSGLHRTPRELAGKNAVQERITGGSVAFGGKRLSAGLTGYTFSLNADYQRNLSFYNQFDFSSSHYRGVGMNYSYLYRNIHAFGEAAAGDNGKFALINGVLVSLHRNFSLAVLHRFYDPAYQSPFAAAFGENSRVANEKGIYLGATWRLSPHWTLYAYADHFAFPWMKFRTYMPSRGSDYQVNLNFDPSRETRVSVRYRRRGNPINSSRDINHPYPDSRVRITETIYRTQFRFNLSYQVSSSVSLRGRMEYMAYTHGKEQESGFLVYQDILYRNPRHPLALTFRAALFDTDGFNSRIYAYEHDVLYAFSFPFYADQGMRTYMVVRWRLHRIIDLYARLARTLYTNRNHSGSGLDRIDGPSRTEVKAQIRLRF